MKGLIFRQRCKVYFKVLCRESEVVCKDQKLKIAKSVILVEIGWLQTVFRLPLLFGLQCALRICDITE